MDNGNKRKAKLLGMPFGTANGRLRKMLLFHFAKKLNMDVCYRCQRRIVELKDFSIEHKRSWMYADNPIETFFDLENIAFSHIKCNIGEGEKPAKIYQNTKERKKAQWSRYYTKHGKELLDRRREKYHKIKGECNEKS